MAVEELKTTINGRYIYARQWSPVQALNMSSRLLNECQHLAIPFIEGNADFDDVLRLLSQVQHDKLLPIVKEFIYCARVLNANNEPTEVHEANVDSIYAGKVVDLLLVFKAVCELQFKDFFEQGRALFPKRVQALKE